MATSKEAIQRILVAEAKLDDTCSDLRARISELQSLLAEAPKRIRAEQAAYARAVIGEFQDVVSVGHTLYWGTGMTSKQIIECLRFNCATSSPCHVVGPMTLWYSCPKHGDVGITLKSRTERDERRRQDAAGHFPDCPQCIAELSEEEEDHEDDLRSMPYDEYLQTEHWSDLRQQKLKQAGFKCQLCNSNGRLHVHHRTYERRGSERLSDLIVLCEGCHAKFHDKGP